jgi:hypothetical protein
MIVHKRGKVTVGRGVKYRGNYRYVTRCGNGIFDFLKPIIQGIYDNKDVISKTMNIAKDVITVGKNTKDVISSIRKKQQPAPPPTMDRNVREIVEKIRALKSGSGFAYA